MTLIGKWWNSCKSTSYYVFILVGGTISLQSKQQQIIALSSTKAKYIASASSTKEVIWIKQLMKEIRFHQVGSLFLHCDNQSCI